MILKLKWLKKHKPKNPNSFTEQLQLRTQTRMMAEEIVIMDVVMQFHLVWATEKGRPQNHKGGQSPPPNQLKSVGKKCRQNVKVGQKRRQNSKVTAKSATTQIRVKKSWWRKVPSKWKSGGGEMPPKQ